MVTGTLHDFGHALRALRTRPAFSALVVGALGYRLACVISTNENPPARTT